SVPPADGTVTIARRPWTLIPTCAMVPTDAMTSPLALDPKTSALLVMDFQTAVVEMVAADKDALLPRTVGLIEAARRAAMRVIYIVVGFRAGYPR
ncbi:MAG: hypothetical protein ACRENE_30905, partial [Polyangiaceae bacterium]